MKSFYRAIILKTVIGVYCLGIQGVQPILAQDQADGHADGFKSLFDGKTLTAWQGREGLWRIEDGVIVGETTPEKKISQNEFLVWQGGEADDFILKVKFRVSGSNQANSGIQFRSQQQPDGRMAGYQADIDASGRYVGILYSEGTGRGILCERGNKVTIASDKSIATETVTDSAELLKQIDLEGWNEMEVEARGNHLVVKINGQVTSTVVDNHPELAATSGLIGFQLHVGPPMKIEFKDIFLKQLGEK